MSHIMDQCQTGIRISRSHAEFKKNKLVNSIPQVEDYRYIGTRYSATPPPMQSPQQTNFNTLPTPVSSISAVFESSEKSSPSSSISSSHSIMASQSRKNAIAELEDTSPGQKLLEMEDTSEAAAQAFKMSSSIIRTGETSRALIAAIDQQLSNLEQENLQLLNALRAAERNLTIAKETAETNRVAYRIAVDAIADRDCQLDRTNGIIAKLEQEADHCRRHHHPPPPPSKSDRVDPPISRFNVDAKRTTAPHPSPVKLTLNRISSATTNASPKSSAASASSPLPSVAEIPGASPCIPLVMASHASQSPSASMISSSSHTQTDDGPNTIFSNSDITPLGYERPVTSRNPLSMHPISIDIPRVGHNSSHLQARDNSVPLILLSPKSSPDLRRSPNKSPRVPNSTDLARRHNQGQSQTPILQSATYPGGGSYLLNPSILNAQHVYIQNQSQKQNRNEKPLSGLKRPATLSLPSGGLTIESSRNPSIFSAPPNATTFPNSSVLGALSTLPSQVRARANSYDRQNCQDQGQRDGQTQTQDLRQRKRGVVIGMFRSKNSDSTADGSCDMT